MLPTLPEKYYLAHARELFEIVETRSSHLLDPAHQNYLQDFSKLNEDAQCLLIRFISRKPQFLKRSSLQYSEISDIDSALEDLVEAGFLSNVLYRDWSNFLPSLTKADLLECLNTTPFTINSSSSKPALLDIATEVFDGDEPSLDSLRQYHFVRRKQDIIDYILFLFFGDLNNRLQKFVMRDLGVLKTRNKTDKQIARFGDKNEAQLVFNLLLQKRRFRSNPSQSACALSKQLLNTPSSGKTVTALRTKLILEVANEMVKRKPEKAIELWRSCEDPKATECWIRESYKSQDRKQLKKELRQLRKLPLTAATEIFIEDFYARKYKGKRTSVYTDMLRESSRLIRIDDSYMKHVEQGVIDHYHGHGISAFFTENMHWRAMFALTFWRLLFTDTQVQHNEFDYLPAVLNRANFYNKNKKAIHECIEILNKPEQASLMFTKIATEHYGYPTGLFQWRSTLLDPILACITYAPCGAIGKVLLEMARDFRQRKDGYPDLMVIDNDALRFEEVKAPGDNLRPNQLLSINSLRKAGFDVDLTQVKWATNPQQIYAVVDIETTGGRKNANSITEIAVVRVQNSKVIGEWSSLVNPQTLIPRYIADLTGITNQMVAGAPTFEQIADDLYAQLSDAIFVAHNVGFDYGFIKKAYERMGRNLERPKFCTVVNSRKTFPGLKSYSLGNLTQHFDIDLDNHHRALSDARATTDLLLLIQDARSAEL